MPHLVFCVGPRSSNETGICGHKIPCPIHIHQKKFLKAYPNIMQGVCETGRRGKGSPGICGQHNCTDHNQPKTPQTKKRKRPQTPMVNDASSLNKKMKMATIPSPTLQREDAFNGIDNLINQYRIEVAEYRERITSLEEKIEMRVRDIDSLLELSNSNATDCSD